MQPKHSSYSYRPMTDAELERYNASFVNAGGTNYRVPFDVAEKMRQLESIIAELKTTK